MTHSRSAQVEELRAVRREKGNRFVDAVVGDAGGIGEPACRGGQRAGLLQSETGRVNRDGQETIKLVPEHLTLDAGCGTHVI